MPSSLSPRRYSRYSPERKRSETPPRRSPTPPRYSGGRSSGSEICKDYQRGGCVRGTTCKFAHVLVDDPPPPVVGGSGNFAPGDWICPSCKAHVFAKRDRCFMCGTPKSSGGGGGGGGGSRAYPDREVLQPFRESGGMPPLGNLCNDFLMGKCGRSVCKFSHDPQAGMEWMAQAMKLREGQSDRRNERRHEDRRDDFRRESDYRRRSPSPQGDIQYERFKRSDGYRVDVPPPPPVMQAILPPPSAFGSRDSSRSEKCNDFKFGRCARGDQCRFVHEKGPLPGDWDCKLCGASNFARRTECFMCRAPKGSEREPTRRRDRSRSRSHGRREDRDRHRSTFGSERRRSRDRSEEDEKEMERERRRRERERSRERRRSRERKQERSPEGPPRGRSRERDLDASNVETFQDRLHSESRSRSRGPRR